MKAQTLQEQVLTIAAITTASIAAYFTPIIPMLWTMMGLIVFDFITRIMKIFKEHKNKSFKEKREKITSYLGKFTPIKGVFYCFFLMAIYAIEVVSFGKSIYIVNAIAVTFYMTELWSIAENLDFCFGNNIFVSAVRKVRKLFETKVDAIISDKSKNTNNKGNEEPPQVFPCP